VEANHDDKVSEETKRRQGFVPNLRQQRLDGSLSQLYYDKSHMATCFDLKEVIFRPFELIYFDQKLVHMICNMWRV
jgi:hypothetical protein